jgi:uncharacterized membrane protein YphA (DoxX/SURF4 family)
MSGNQATESTLGSAGLLAGRLLLALIFVHEGWSIIRTYSGATAYMEKFGVPGMPSSERPPPGTIMCTWG